ncbi:RNA-directed DNA polymerase from mobile element jockey [Trichonephila clavipes]|uniref:RNA-directed DNA polymerase from mobile element jockey n=1 Tax=Trichonephila clavipes TaxID=2585209 RepID=A0A8X6VP03_TRICX|nr:RNA-directed DNA polymerase from mobile element jockey [Trichonephila clavipes]
MSDIFEIQHDSHLLVYADDIFLYNNGTNWNKTIGEMEESLNKISVWCKKWKLATSPEKSSLINFSRKRSKLLPLLKICDKPILEAKSLKILGIIFDPNITWKNHINYLRQKAFKYLNAIKALSSPKIGTRSDHLLNILNATIRSIFDYGSQLFSFSSNSNRQKLEPIYNAALRLALVIPRNTPSPPTVSTSLFADDSAALTQGVQLNYTIKAMQNYLVILENWLTDWRIAINVEKTQAIVFRKWGVIDPQTELILFKDNIHWVPVDRYVGLHIDSRLTYKKHIDYLSDKFWGRIALVISLIGRNSPLSLEIN